MSIEIVQADQNSVQIIRNLAFKIWPSTFKEILTAPQIEYMLEMMYSVSKLEEQMNCGHQFFLVNEGLMPLGFIGIEIKHPEKDKTKVHKLYVLPQSQGKGLGKLMLDKVGEIALSHHTNSLVLNVNRFNKAVDFYLKYGFEITKEEDIDIGNGYFMNDFVMEFKL